ncbi:MAG: Gfo/Idh/MocA family oxidoreductase [Lachnospiraceae bacterium]|jgi:myo-inositol 2-dehydrogenase/D-chiro-inositol 1-dehydrogenase|nr:Gfo/Idh/MocA family oxidoreductase [Lachnospiraceae bacterium]
MGNQGLRVVIVGAGVMGGIHAKIAAGQDGAKICYVVDASKERAGKLAADYGALALTDISGIPDGAADFAYVCLPNDLHADAAVAALEKGLHTFCEKPMATGVADATRMGKAARRMGRRLFVGHNRRFAPVYLAAKEAVDGEGFAPHSINMIQNDGDMGGEGSLWAADFVHLGGFLYDTTIHFLDMAEFLVGGIREVRALSQSACYPVEDDFAIQLRFEGGAIGAITSCGHASWVFPFERVQVVGDHRSVITEELDSFRHCPGLSQAIVGRDYSKMPFETKWGYAPMHEAMMGALETGRPSPNDWEVGLRAVELVAACLESAARGGAAVGTRAAR